MNSLCFHRWSTQGIGLICLLVGILPTPVFAGTFTVTPVRIYMAPNDRATAITITNEGDEEIVMQADLYLWEQLPGGKDDLTLTEDIFLAPPVIKLAPKSQQVVRLARVGQLKRTEQSTYRMIVREVPEAKPPQPGVALQIALAFSIPVFVTPPGAQANLNCRMERVAANTVSAVCENSGKAHTHITAFQLYGSSGDKVLSEESGGYLLSGIKRSFELKRKDGNIAAGKATLEVTLADGTTKNYDVSITD